MNCFRLLEHTADIGIEAIADSREGLVEQSVYGLRKVLFGEFEGRPLEKRQVAADGHTPEETLVNWLNELLFLMEARRFLPVKVEVQVFSDTDISASVTGENVDPDEHPLRHEVKGVTHHKTMVGCDQQGWRAHLYLDL